MQAGAPTEVPFHTYNFGTEAATGSLRIEGLPQGWTATPASWDANIEPGDRHEQIVRFTLPPNGVDVFDGMSVTCAGRFGNAGDPVLQFRVIGDPLTLVPTVERPIQAALQSEAWIDNINKGGTLTHSRQNDAMRFDMTFTDADPWSYPYVILAPEDVPDESIDGLAFTLQVYEGEGTLRLQFAEEDGASYLVDTRADAAVRTPQKVLVFLSHAQWGVWSPADTNGTLDAEKIRRVLVGVNGKRNSSISYSVSDMRWVRIRQ